MLSSAPQSFMEAIWVLDGELGGSRKTKGKQTLPKDWQGGCICYDDDSLRSFAFFGTNFGVGGVFLLVLDNFDGSPWPLGKIDMDLHLQGLGPTKSEAVMRWENILSSWKISGNLFEHTE